VSVRSKRYRSGTEESTEILRYPSLCAGRRITNAAIPGDDNGRRAALDSTLQTVKLGREIGKRLYVQASLENMRANRASTKRSRAE
jgi:hypothetical protein